MRTFPRAARLWTTGALTAVVALGALTVAVPQPDDAVVDHPVRLVDDDLKSKQRQVKGEIADQKHELEHASKEAARANQRFLTTKRRLGVAQGRLSSARDEVAKARAVDRRAQRRLRVSRVRLATAQRRLAEGRAELEAQRADLREDVLDLYSKGAPELRALGAWLSGSSVQDIARDRVSESVVVGRGRQTFDDLAVVEDRLAGQKVRVQRATTQVRADRASAAQSLRAVRAGFKSARAARNDVKSLTSQARTAKTQAFKAMRRDRGELKKLETREATIRQRLKERAARQKGPGYTGRSDGFLSSPVPGGYTTSPYGYRTHPIYGYYALHNGIDFGKGCGTRLVAGSSGTVINRYSDSVYGNRLYLAVGNVHGKNMVLVYNHMSGYAANVGDKVERGETVGYMGTTGWSTGCHLHFTVLLDGDPVDPAPYL
ncbi:MAG: hypothetical protein CMH83_13610 [Nocardioides sp.]|nr:hypothetical protein [Nocardioides sp.]